MSTQKKKQTNDSVEKESRKEALRIGKGTGV
jgi:hypothetical protein